MTQDWVSCSLSTAAAAPLDRFSRFCRRAHKHNGQISPFNIIVAAAAIVQARLAQSAERKALNLVVVGSSPTVGVFLLPCRFAATSLLPLATRSVAGDGGLLWRSSTRISGYMDIFHGELTQRPSTYTADTLPLSYNRPRRHHARNGTWQRGGGPGCLIGRGLVQI